MTGYSFLSVYFLNVDFLCKRARFMIKCVLLAMETEGNKFPCVDYTENRGKFQHMVYLTSDID